MKRWGVEADVADELERPLSRVEADLLGARSQVGPGTEHLFFEREIIGLVGPWTSLPYAAVLVVERGRFTRECRARKRRDEHGDEDAADDRRDEAHRAPEPRTRVD